ncbi:MAG TPA: hypothetical protein VMH20_19255 [Verrucomicrobiae bacterium]|jgi:hypothetical protein|nr:hypothetical protein [Verrucomicrobiae bacterium]
MSKKDGIRWHCPNRDCNWTVVAIPDAGEIPAEPRCICGRTMQRGDAVPAFHYLDFLRDDTADEKEAGAANKE